MAVTGTITRSRENDFVEVADSEDQLRQFVENANPGDHVTIHSGTYNTSTVTGGEIEIPQDVAVTILPNADVQLDTGGGSLNYPIFGGATGNIVNLNILASGLYKDSVVIALEDVGGLNLEKLTVDDSGSAPTLTVNTNDNSEIKFGKFDKNRILYTSTSDGKVKGSSELVFDPQNDILTVKGDQVLTGDLSVDGDLDFGSGDADGPVRVGDLGVNRVVTTNNAKELRTQNGLKFDGTNFILENSVNLLYNKSSADGGADIHFKPTSGVLIQGESGTSQDGGRLIVNESSIFSDRAFHVNQGGKSIGFFLKTSSGKTGVMRVRNTDQSSDILKIDSDRKVTLADVMTDTLSTKGSFINVDSNNNSPQGGIRFRDDLRIRYNTSSSKWEFTDDGTNFTALSDIHLSKVNPERFVVTDSNGDFTTTSNLQFNGSTALLDTVLTNELSTNGEFITVNANGSNANAGISVNGNVSIRYNVSQSQWEFTDDGTNFTAFNSISTYTETVVTDNINGGGGSREIVLSNQFSDSPTPNEVSIRTWVKDSTSGNATSGDWIDASGIITVVRDFGNNYSFDYKVYNEHPDSQDFKLSLRKYR